MISKKNILISLLFFYLSGISHGDEIFEKGKEILDKSGLKILSAMDLNDAARKIIQAVK